jgi:hypothetical protein
MVTKSKTITGSKTNTGTKKCPPGEIWRVGYTRKRGSKSTKVAGNCIHSTSASGEKRSLRDKKIIAQKEKMHKTIAKKYGTPKCSKGEIVRAGYKRKGYTRKSGSKVSKTEVAASCIKSVTGKTHGKQLFVLEKGELSKYGYHDVKNMSTQERRNALKQALQHLPPLTVFRKINALKVLNKDKDPNIAKIFQNDEDWIRTTPEYKQRPTSKSKSKGGAKGKSKSGSKLKGKSKSGSKLKGKSKSGSKLKGKSKKDGSKGKSKSKSKSKSNSKLKSKKSKSKSGSKSKKGGSKGKSRTMSKKDGSKNKSKSKSNGKSRTMSKKGGSKNKSKSKSNGKSRTMSKNNSERKSNNKSKSKKY